MSTERDPMDGLETRGKDGPTDETRMVDVDDANQRARRCIAEVLNEQADRFAKLARASMVSKNAYANVAGALRARARDFYDDRAED